VNFDFIVGNNRDINQRKRLAIYRLRYSQVIETIEPAHTVRIGTLLTMVKQYRYYQRQSFMALLQMTVHGGNAIAQQTKGHHLPVIIQVAGALAILGPPWASPLRGPARALFKSAPADLSSLTPVTYLSKLLGIRCVAAFLQLELFRVDHPGSTDAQ